MPASDQGREHLGSVPRGELGAFKHERGERVSSLTAFTSHCPALLGRLCRYVRGQAPTQSTLEVVAVGDHDLLLMRIPGCGGTLLPSRCPTYSRIPRRTTQRSRRQLQR